MDNFFKKPIKFRKSWIRPLVLLIILMVMLQQVRSYFTGLFFYPDQEDGGNPAYRRIPFDDVVFKALDGRQLNGFFLKPKNKPKGTIVHCHGNAGNITFHYSLTLFLVEAGYNVFCFDYGGYGKSEGRPSPKIIIKDTVAALNYVKSREDVDKTKIALFGQSLGGGAAASGAMVQDPTVKCLVLEATFTTYREMAWSTSLGKMLFFLTPFVIPDKGPKKDLQNINGRPVLIVHGEEDALIPLKFSRDLYETARAKKALTILEGFNHLQGSEGEPEYQKAILDFLKTHLTP